VHSTDAWGESPVISDDVRKMLATKEFENEAGYKENIGKDAEAAASRAMGVGSDETVERAKKLCQARVDWKLEIGKKCERFLATEWTRPARHSRARTPLCPATPELPWPRRPLQSSSPPSR
jgi:hypothetical protein